jgi:hypothetical protein
VSNPIGAIGAIVTWQKKELRGNDSFSVTREKESQYCCFMYVGVVILFCLSLISCGSDVQERPEYYDSDYDWGYDIGSEEGYDDGFRRGYEEGYRDGQKGKRSQY